MPRGPNNICTQKSNVQDGWNRAPASVDLEELDLELQRGIRRDHRREAACTICLNGDWHTGRLLVKGPLT